uniref:Uncharacterized protein LOC111118929 n=1 Tax=Crassostrea virginica TaxID=6565 RepID=A0A8B8CIS5_CRAVI|nr:uncharacterized protein LOC111118929 [Crassostrea virginica]
MDELERDLGEFFCQLENCDEGQSQIFEDIIEAFDTYVNEILCAFNFEIGANDSINVTNLLFTDFLKLTDMFQSDQSFEVRGFLTHLQKYEKNRLCCLQGNISSFRPSSKVDRMPEIKEKIKFMKTDEMADLKDFLTLSENAIKIIVKVNYLFLTYS